MSDSANPFMSLVAPPTPAAPAAEPEPKAPAATDSGSNPFLGLVTPPAGAEPTAPEKPADTESNPFMSLVGDHNIPDPGNDRTVSHVDDPNEPWYSKTWDYLNKSLYDLHRHNAGPIETGVEDVASSLTSPLSIALTIGTLGSAAIGAPLEAGGIAVLKGLGVTEKAAPIVVKGIQTLVDTGFTGQQIFGLATQVPAVFDALKEGDYDTAKRLGTASLIGGSFAYLGAKGAFRSWGRLNEETGLIKPNKTLEAIRTDYEDLQEKHEVNNDQTKKFLETYNKVYDDMRPDLSKDEKVERLAAINRWIGAGGDEQTLLRRKESHLGTLQTREEPEPETETPEQPGKIVYAAVNPRNIAETERHGVLDRTFHATPEDAVKDFNDNAPAQTVTVPMKISDFLKTVGEEGQVNARQVEDYRRQIAKDNWKYKGQPLELHYDADKNIIDANGRHRALAAQQAGLKTIDVAVTRDNPTPAVYGFPEGEVQAASKNRGEIVPGEPIQSMGQHLPTHRVVLDDEGNPTGAAAPVEGRAPGPLDLDKVEHPEATTTLGKLTNAEYLEKYTPAEKDRLIREYDIAANLTDAEKEFAQRVSDGFEQVGNKAQEHGMLKHMIDNYITNTWKPEDQDNAAFNQLRHQSGSGAFETNIPFARQRMYETDFQAEMLGRKKAISDPIALLARYQHTLDDAIANKKFLEALQDKGVRMPDGRPITAIAGSGQKLGEASDNPAIVVNPNGMRTLMIAQDEVDRMNETGELKKLVDAGIVRKLHDRLMSDPEGDPEDKKMTATYGWNTDMYKSIDHHSMRGWNYITDDHADKPVYMKGDLKVHPEAEEFIRQVIGADKSALRNSPVLTGAMKVSQQAKRLLLSLSPFHIVQEGLRAVMTGINPFGTLKFDLVNDPVLREGVRNGLTLTKDYKALDDYTDGVSGNSYLLNKIPGLGKLQSSFEHFLFNDYIPGLKARAYKSLVERYRNYGDATPMASAAAHANELFGGLNYKMLGRSATTQDVMRLGLLAPDWLESEVRLIKRSLGGNGAAAQRIANIDNVRIMGAMYLGARVLNLMMSGKTHQETPFGVVQEGKNGQDDTVYSLRTLPTDMLHALTDPRAFLEGRLNPLTVRTPMDLISGRDEYGRKVDPAHVLARSINNIAPIGSQSIIPKLVGFPTDLNAWQQIARAAGAAPYKYRTEAEKLASQYAANKMPSGPEDPYAKAQYIRGLNAEDALRNGQITKADVRNMPEMSKERATQIIKRSDMTPIQARADRATMKELVEIYQVATNSEKEQLHDMMWKRRAAWLKQHKPDERATDPTYIKLKQVYPDLS